MLTKLFEVRDKSTFIPALATKLDTYDNDKQRLLLHRAGFVDISSPSPRHILVCPLNGRINECHTDQKNWSDRTMAAAHKYIVENWSELEDGDVIDYDRIMTDYDRL